MESNRVILNRKIKQSLEASIDGLANSLGWHFEEVNFTLDELIRTDISTILETLDEHAEKLESQVETLDRVARRLSRLEQALGRRETMWNTTTRKIDRMEEMMLRMQEHMAYQSHQMMMMWSAAAGDVKVKVPMHAQTVRQEDLSSTSAGSDSERSTRTTTTPMERVHKVTRMSGTTGARR